MPEVDLTIEGPDDVERWLSEYLRWSSWLLSNPTVDQEVLRVVLIESPMLDRMTEGNGRVLDAAMVGVGGVIEIVSVEPNMENFGIGLISAVVETRRSVPLWTLDAATLTVTHELGADPEDVSFIADVLLQSRPSSQWGLVSWRRR